MNESGDPTLRMQRELASFVVMSRGNKWFESDRRISLYLRRGQRYINRVIVECIDIASVEVREEYQAKGIFTKYLWVIERLAKQHKLVVYVENIHNPILGTFMLKRGYERILDIEDLCVSKQF